VVCLADEFKPASIDTGSPGTLHKGVENKVTVEFSNNQAGKPKVAFQGNSEDCKDMDAVIFFDGTNFRLERLHRAVKSLRHLRQGETGTALAGSGGGGSGAVSPIHSNGGHANAEKNAFKAHHVLTAWCLPSYSCVFTLLAGLNSRWMCLCKFCLGVKEQSSESSAGC